MALTQTNMYIVCTILVALATMTVAARLRVRLMQKAKVRMDDWTAFGGLVSGRYLTTKKRKEMIADV
jgi:hypothetical protein